MKRSIIFLTFLSITHSTLIIVLIMGRLLKTSFIITLSARITRSVLVKSASWNAILFSVTNRFPTLMLRLPIQFSQAKTRKNVSIKVSNPLRETIIRTKRSHRQGDCNFRSSTKKRWSTSKSGEAGTESRFHFFYLPAG